jgi:uncharacterized protein (TIGR02147 family)
MNVTMKKSTLSLEQQDEPLIFNYHDYREFLRDYLRFQKKHTKSFNLRSLSKAAGFTPAFFTMVLNGRRSWSEATIDKLLPLLKLDPSSQSYFRLLCTVADSPSQENRLQALNKLQNYRRYRKMNPKENEVYRYLTKWYYVAIRELATTPGFKLDATWVQERLQFQVSQVEVKKALEFLQAQEFIKVKSDGSVELPSKQLDCKQGVYQMALAEFHQQMLELAGKSIKAAPKTERAILGHTFAIKKKDFEKLYGVLERTMKEMIEIEGESQDSDSVYHVALAAFPLTTSPGGRNDKA